MSERSNAAKAPMTPGVPIAAAVTDPQPAGQAPSNFEVTNPALRGFRRLPEKAAAAIVEFVTGVLADNPYRLSKPLTNQLLGLRPQPSSCQVEF
jgi:pyruvate-formate lyase-activating enzyme